MNKILLKIFIIILIIMLLVAFSSSYSALNLENLAVVVAIGIDTSKDNKLDITFQFTDALSVSESGSSESAPSILYTVETSSITSGINLMNSYIGKEVNLSHCKVIAFSEKIAARGISDEIYTLINDAQVRPSTNIVVSKCSAKYYLQNSKPIFENLITKYYEVFSNSSQHTGFTVNATVGNFFDDLLTKSGQPFAILGGVTNDSTNYSSNIDSEKDFTSKSNSSAITGKTNSENMGLAVFKNDVLVGELNSIETLCSLIVRSQVDSFLISVPNPNKSNSYVDLHLTPLSESKIKVTIINGTPYIDIVLKFTGRIYSMEANSDYLSSEMLNLISNSCNSYLESIITDYLYKTSKNFKSDINNFGNDAKRSFLFAKDFSDYNWNEKYKDSFFNVHVNSSIQSSSILTES